jgi:hypothetical protein
MKIQLGREAEAAEFPVGGNHIVGGKAEPRHDKALRPIQRELSAREWWTVCGILSQHTPNAPRGACHGNLRNLSENFTLLSPISGQVNRGD